MVFLAIWLVKVVRLISKSHYFGCDYKNWSLEVESPSTNQSQTWIQPKQPIRTRVKESFFFLETLFFYVFKALQNIILKYLK